MSYNKILESVKWKTEAIKKSSDIVSCPWLPKSNNFLSELFTKKKKEKKKSYFWHLARPETLGNDIL